MKHLICEETERVMLLTLNLPQKRNILTPDLLADLTQVLRKSSESGTSKPVVITGAGDKAFCAGYNIGDLSPTSPDQGLDRKEFPLEKALQEIQDYPYPVIAMINGYALGGGCELAVTCDIRVASDNAVLGMPPAKIGLVYPYQGLRRFLNALGYAKTMEMFLTGRRYDSQNSLAAGLVNYVVPQTELKQFTLTLAEEIAANAPLSLKGTKWALKRIARYPELPPQEIEALSSLFIRSLTSEDFKEGKLAFQEKRSPDFKGL